MAVEYLFDDAQKNCTSAFNLPPTHETRCSVPPFPPPPTPSPHSSEIQFIHLYKYIYAYNRVYFHWCRVLRESMASSSLRRPTTSLLRTASGFQPWTRCVMLCRNELANRGRDQLIRRTYPEGSSCVPSFHHVRRLYRPCACVETRVNPFFLLQVHFHFCFALHYFSITPGANSVRF